MAQEIVSSSKKKSSEGFSVFLSPNKHILFIHAKYYISKQYTGINKRMNYESLNVFSLYEFKHNRENLKISKRIFA